MSGALRIVDTGLRPACWNVAMTAALTELRGLGAVGNTVRLHRYPPCVLLGAGQDAEEAADVEHCRRFGIAIARRVTGGGAVYMSPTMLAWDVVVGRAAFGGGLDGLTRRVCEGVAAGLARLGVSARYRPPNDVEIGGRKVSGSAGYAAGRGAVLQGTILRADETAAMAGALRLPEAALRERTTSLAAEIKGAAPSLAALADAIIEGLAEAFDCAPVRDCLRDNEMALCEALLRGDAEEDGCVPVGSLPA